MHLKKRPPKVNGWSANRRKGRIACPFLHRNNAQRPYEHAPGGMQMVDASLCAAAWAVNSLLCRQSTSLMDSIFFAVKKHKMHSQFIIFQNSCDFFSAIIPPSAYASIFSARSSDFIEDGKSNKRMSSGSSIKASKGNITSAVARSISSEPISKPHMLCTISEILYRIWISSDSRIESVKSAEGVKAISRRIILNSGVLADSSIFWKKVSSFFSAVRSAVQVLSKKMLQVF